jgi:hypothetical protein
VIEEVLMNRTRLVGGCLVALLTALSSAETLAQRGMHWTGSGGWGPGTAYGRMYDPKTVTKVQGAVVVVDTFAYGGMSRGVHLTLLTGRDTLQVHLGPQWFVSAQDTKLAVGDSVVVEGSRITFEGRPAVIAARITRGRDVLTLRHADGFPVWVGWRRRNQ